MNKFYAQLGTRIKKLRKRLGLSQEVLSQKIGINRVSLSHIEKGERKVNVGELTKIAQMFNTSTDLLLDLEKDIKVVLEKKKEITQKKEEVIRISVPQKNVEKFKEALIYILNKVGSKPNIGETVLYKLLYFIDFDFYEKYEEQFIGATYIKNHYGPTPLEFAQIVKEMEGKDLRKVSDKYFKYPQTKYLPLRKPDLTKLKANETALIDEVLERLSDMNANQISEYSHNDVPWLATEDKEVINYEAVFYRQPTYSVRSYPEENI